MVSHALVRAVVSYNKTRETLRWRHNEHDSVSNRQPHDCLLNLYSSADQSKHQSSASLAFVWEIHRGPVNFPHKWPVTRKMFPFDDVIMPYAKFLAHTVPRGVRGFPIWRQDGARFRCPLRVHQCWHHFPPATEGPWYCRDGCRSVVGSHVACHGPRCSRNCGTKQCLVLKEKLTMGAEFILGKIKMMP